MTGIRFSAGQRTLIDQLQQWPNADHDDGPDCLDMLWQNALIYAGGGTWTSQGGVLTSGASGSDRWGDYRS